MGAFARSRASGRSNRARCTDIYREEPSRRRECLYYLGLGNYKLGNFDEARRYNSASRPTDHGIAS
jgi:fission 1 protein